MAGAMQEGGCGGGGLAYTELGFCLDWDRGGIPRVLQNHSIGKFKIEE